MARVFFPIGFLGWHHCEDRTIYLMDGTQKRHRNGAATGNILCCLTRALFLTTVSKVSPVWTLEFGLGLHLISPETTCVLSSFMLSYSSHCTCRQRRDCQPRIWLWDFCTSTHRLLVVQVRFYQEVEWRGNMTYFNVYINTFYTYKEFRRNKKCCAS